MPRTLKEFKQWKMKKKREPMLSIKNSLGITELPAFNAVCLIRDETGKIKVTRSILSNLYKK